MIRILSLLLLLATTLCAQSSAINSLMLTHLSIVVTKYGGADQVPPNSIRWLAKKYQTTESNIQQQLEKQFPAPTAKSNTLPLPKLELIGKNTEGYLEYRRSKDNQVMVLIPAGRFLYGSSRNGKTAHTIHLDAFLIDKTEISVEQYRKFLKATGHREPTATEYCSDYYEDFIPYWNLQKKYPNNPVQSISWHDANTYAKWAGVRLPFEAEWAKAARGKDGRLYTWGNNWWGNTEADLAKQKQLLAEHNTENLDIDEFLEKYGNTYGQAWDLANVNWFPDGSRMPYLVTNGKLINQLYAVGRHPRGASPFGVMNLFGNVQEWCNDWFDGAYLNGPPKKNPKVH